MLQTTIRKCRRAYLLMRDDDVGLGAAAKRVGTTSRTLKRYFKNNKIRIIIVNQDSRTLIINSVIDLLPFGFSAGE